MSGYVDLEELKRQASRVVDLACRGGATTAVAVLDQNADLNLEVRNGEIENLNEAESHLVRLTVSKHGRRATVSSCDWLPDSLNGLVERAMEMCRYTDNDPCYTLPETDLLAQEVGDLDLFDEDLLEMGTEEKIHMAVDLERQLLARDQRLISESTKLSTVVGGSAIANSAGFCQAETSSLIGVSAMAFAEDRSQGDLNTGRKQKGYWYSEAHHIEDLEPSENIAAKAADRILRKLGARKPATGKYPVYFEPPVARSLWAHLLNAMSGSELYRHESYLVDRLGTRVCSPAVTIADDPKRKRGLGSRAYDAEGVATSYRILVEEGMLRSYLLGTYSANKLKMRSTGHAGGPGNVVIQPGDLDESEMLRRMGTGVWVTSLFGQGANTATGDYSRGAFGLWVENGKIAYPIMEFTLNSHLDRMFQDVVMVGGNVQQGFATLTPGIVVGEMTIGGG